ncbi:MAG: 50S ribosomal protein L2 [Candidatus Parcubacteria bacterium]|nr:50S ribosomal protein L2 [Candidatus Parcubacteria bacterium]
MKPFKPTTPSRRHMTKEDFSVLTKKEPEKSLTFRLPKRGGRAGNGRMTVRHKGGGARKIYRMVDFGQERINVPAKVVAIEYDPNRSAFIVLLEYQDGKKRYRIAPAGLKSGDSVICAETAEIKMGNRMKLRNIPVGTVVHDVELEAGRGGKLVRGAGTAARVIAQENRYTHLEMPSKEVRMVFNDCFASVGNVSRVEHKYIKLGKAGKSRHRGIRPSVRGTAMNACDHPHGGGEGKSPIGMPGPRTPWGKPARGVKTRRKKNWTSKYIVKRKKVK